MLRTVSTPLLLAGLCAFAGAQPVAAGTTSTVRYVSPTGVTTGECPITAPCDLAYAIATAAGDNTVLIEPGTYYQATPLSESLQDESKHLTIEGSANGAPPLIYSAATDGFLLSNSSLTRVDLIYSGNNSGIFAHGGPVSDVEVVADTGTACATFVSLTNSICVALGTDAAAVDVASGAGGGSRIVTTPVIRGVTAESYGTGGDGIEADAGDSVTISMDVVNDIVHGAGADLRTNTNDLTGTNPTDLKPIALIHADHSDFATESATTEDGPVNPAASITSAKSDIKVPPKFIDEAHEDLREKRSSPTVNTGAADPAGTDFAGNPRTLGKAPDMGAYEYRQHPTTEPPALVKRSATSLKIADVVNGEGLRTKVELVVTRHGKFVQAVKDPHAVTHAVKVRFRIHALKRGTSYRVQVVATNAVGTVRTAKVTVKTRS